MPKTKQKSERVSVRIAPNVKQAAEKELDKHGLSISNYIQYALANVANGSDDNYLNTPDALEAKYEAEHGETKKIGSLNDFEKYTKEMQKEVNNED
ncbi:RelB [Apilactobacillus micheneri]|uniref:RelB n=1 Tax=Apilactobacillus micheneri TaxID=1899430 RepID=A0ABY2YV15_9LACO|nr:type II toxin-antitoxin system RelB/DinJ family antitoxin [Apilactobacillus micheneri]TPR22831.1 RelB [Apilactobacillus micheneri]TPR24403.1 RelB [Apilactobacillus micheneri]TPR27281.1 RelB [Apilactobacillus micheneri]TPR28663.1 RelB [Apilactobacillus micheneri]TPR28723.1 RelB [Apilactobacillus micheneri]